MKFPLVWRSTAEIAIGMLQTENRQLLVAIRDANVEIRMLRRLLADITDKQFREAALKRIDEGKSG